jgi:hypothetical protein
MHVTAPCAREYKALAIVKLKPSLPLGFQERSGKRYKAALSKTIEFCVNL